MLTSLLFIFIGSQRLEMQVQASEWSLFFDADVLAGDGMGKFEGFGMEAEPVGRVPVERVAHDGSVQPEGMGGMHAELVRPPRKGVEVYQRAPLAAGDDGIARHGRFSVPEIDALPGAVVRVGSEGQFDDALVRREDAFHPGGITLPDCLAVEECLHLPVSLCILGKEQQPGGCHVQAVDVPAAGIACLDQLR